MFTGIVQHRGTIVKTVAVEFGRKLVVDASAWNHRPVHGESICVSGVCLTCTSHEGKLAFDVIAQTLKCTTLGDLAKGDAVNLEPCVTPTTLLGGHIVQGHVDGVGIVRDRVETSEEVRLTIEAPPELRDYIVPKGSVALDGVSMTLAEVRDEVFEIALIPTTIELTTLGLAEVGTRVNLEADIMVKTIAHLVRRMSEPGESPGPSPATLMDTLAQPG